MKLSPGLQSATYIYFSIMSNKDKIIIKKVSALCQSQKFNAQKINIIPSLQLASPLNTHPN